MKTIRIRNIPDDIHTALRVKCFEMGITMEKYVMELIHDAVMIDKQTKEGK